MSRIFRVVQAARLPDSAYELFYERLCARLDYYPVNYLDLRSCVNDVIALFLGPKGMPAAPLFRLLAPITLVH